MAVLLSWVGLDSIQSSIRARWRLDVNTGAHREQPEVKVDADDYVGNGTPGPALGLGQEKLRAHDVHVYMSSIGISCKKVI